MFVLELAQCGVALFFGVLFLQSGIDKVTDRAGNLAWMAPHFEASPLRGRVPLLLSVLTLFELAAGLMCLVASTSLILPLPARVVGYSLLMCMLVLLMLFAGQRLAKDYAGAASLAGYFAVAVLGLLLHSMVV